MFSQPASNRGWTERTDGATFTEVVVCKEFYSPGSFLLRGSWPAVCCESESAESVASLLNSRRFCEKLEEVWSLGSTSAGVHHSWCHLVIIYKDRRLRLPVCTCVTYFCNIIWLFVVVV